MNKGLGKKESVVAEPVGVWKTLTNQAYPTSPGGEHGKKVFTTIFVPTPPRVEEEEPSEVKNKFRKKS